MLKRIAFLTVTSILFAGCAAVPTENVEVSNVLKQVKAPSTDNAGLYIYRSNSVVGAALKKDIWVDDECIGETARGTFFYHEVLGNKEHKVSTESEFSPNDLMVMTETGQNYFVKQYIKPGLFVGGAGLKLVPESEGKEAIADLELGIKGTCSK
jgi:hypothetical protein